MNTRRLKRRSGKKAVRAACCFRKHFLKQTASRVTRLASGSTLAGQRLEKNLWKHFHNIGKELLGNMSQKSGDSRDKAGARRASDRTFWVGTSGDFRYRYGRRRPGFTRESQCVLNSFQGVRGCLRLRAEWWGAKILYMHSQRNPRPTVHVFSGDPGKPDIDSIWTSTGQNDDTDQCGIGHRTRQAGTHTSFPHFLYENH